MDSDKPLTELEVSRISKTLRTLLKNEADAKQRASFKITDDLPGWQDEEGVVYESRFTCITTHLGLCGCIDDDIALEISQKCFTLLNYWADETKAISKSPTIGFENGRHTTEYYLLASLMDAKGLIEHGSSIRFPWLTQTGEKILFLMREEFTEKLLNA